jgi:hypothetical protein
MRRVKKAAVVGIAVAIALVFFLAPVSYWYTIPVGRIVCHQLGPLEGGCPVALFETTAPVYRSLGCQTMGIGVLYTRIPPPDWAGFFGNWSNWSGLHLGCGPDLWDAAPA